MFNIEGTGGADIPEFQKARVALLMVRVAESIKAMLEAGEAKPSFALMTCTDKATGKPVEALVLVNETDERVDFLPVAIIPRDRDLCDLLTPPGDCTVNNPATTGVNVDWGQRAERALSPLSGNVLPFDPSRKKKKPNPFDIN